MEYRRLGRSELKASALSLGAWEFGTDNDFATADQNAVDRVVDAALDAGINLFDTAQVYGNGRSEEMLGRALRGKRDKALIATKFIEFEEWRADDILARLEASLRRLATDYVDLYQMHWPKNDMTDDDVEIMVQAFDTAIQRGWTRCVGVSNFRRGHVDLLPPTAGFASNQVPLSLLWRYYDVEGTSDLCRERDLSCLVYCPLAQGLLTGRYTREDPPASSPLTVSKWLRPAVYPAAMTVVDEVIAVAEACGRTPAQVALNWLLQRDVVGSLIVGTRKPAHLHDDLGVLGWQLEADLAQRLDAASLHFQEKLDPAWQGTWGDR